jgi:hypothetical protein
VSGAAAFFPKSHNSKLSRVVLEGGSLRAYAPHCSATYASIQRTCPAYCPLKRDEGGAARGCYADAGLTRMTLKRMDDASVGMTGLSVIREEARAIRESFGGGPVPQDGPGGKGRPLRVHVGGDASTPTAARELADAARDWRARGGGTVWSYTHAWPSVTRRSWGPISCLASIEHVSQAEAAGRRGYVAALVVARFPSRRRFTLEGEDFIPCPAQTGDRTCVSCRLCFDDEKLLRLGAGIAFELHGTASTAAAVSLTQLRLPIAQVAR